MELLLNIMLIASCLFLIALAVRTGANIKLIAMPALFAMILFFMVWVIGNLIEVNSADFQWMLIGRNIQQIGVFFTPLSTLYFSLDYAGNRKFRWIAYILSVIQSTSVFLIFTDQRFHIMRKSIEVQANAVLGHAVVVHSTNVGSVLVALNFCIPLISLAILAVFARTVSTKLRRPLWLIMISFLATFIIATVQSTVLSNIGINIPIPVLNLPCVILLSYAVLKGGFLGVAPTALNKVFEVIDQGIIVVDQNGVVMEHNARATELMRDIDFPDRIKVGSGILEMISGIANSPQCFTISDLPKEFKGNQSGEYVSLACHALEKIGGKFIGYVLVLTDITMLKIRAEIDSLTGSYNREGLSNAFSGLQKKYAPDQYISAMIIDMDDFKNINDTYGHLGGDIILRDLVSAAQALLSERHFIGRLGGDEFVVILSTEIETAIAMAEKLCRCVSERHIQYLNYMIQYTVSIGVASCVNSACLFSDLLHQADLALYQAKKRGKNTVSAQR